MQLVEEGVGVCVVDVDVTGKLEEVGSVLVEVIEGYIVLKIKVIVKAWVVTIKVVFLTLSKMFGCW